VIFQAVHTPEKHDKKISYNVVTIELSVKDPKLGVLGPSFTKSRDEIKNRDEKSTQVEKDRKKAKTKLVVSPKMVPTGVSPQVLALCYLSLLCC
jgi:hypothetical protein